MMEKTNSATADVILETRRKEERLVEGIVYTVFVFRRVPNGF